MSIEIVSMIAAVAWFHGRCYPWTTEMVKKQQERRLEARREKARQEWYGARFNKESAH